MKKLLGIVVLGLLLGSYAYSANMGYLEKNINANGGHVKKYGNPSVTKIAPIANAQCQSFNPGSRAVNLKQVHKGGFFSSPEFSYWHYDCQGQSQASSSSGKSTNDKIAQSKQICKDLGFKTNTEKFADCALKMMSMNFEATNKVSSGSGTTQQIIVQQPSYDIWDALLDMSFMLQNNNSSSSSGSSGTRCVVNRTNSMTGQTVMNCY